MINRGLGFRVIEGPTRGKLIVSQPKRLWFSEDSRLIDHGSVLETYIVFTDIPLVLECTSQVRKIEIHSNILDPWGEMEVEEKITAVYPSSNDISYTLSDVKFSLIKEADPKAVDKHLNLLEKLTIALCATHDDLVTRTLARLRTGE